MPYIGLQSVRLGSTAECIKDCFTIIYPDAYTVLDTTYGTGRFWKWAHQLQITGLDVVPTAPHILEADYRHIPEHLGSFDVICWDPMFIFSPGISRIMGTRRFFDSEKADTHDVLAKPRNPADLLEHARLIFRQAKERARVGLLVKGQDLVVQQSDWWLRNLMNIGEQEGAGLPYDILIQVSRSHRLADKRWKNQYHFRRAHAFYVCYRWDGGKALHKRNESCTATMAT